MSLVDLSVLPNTSETETLVLPVHEFGTVCHGLRTLGISYKHFKILLKTYMFV